MKYKIAVTTSDVYPVRMDKVEGVFKDSADIKEVQMPFRELNKAEIKEFKPKFEECDGILVRSGVFSEGLLQELKKLKVICVHGAGYDQIDVKAAEKLGIAVLNTPGANANAVIELTIGLMLTVQRRLYYSTCALKNDNDWTKAKCLGRELKGKTLGLFGFGKIGRGVAKCALALGMDVKVYDPYIKKIEGMDEVELCEDQDCLLSASDVLSLHAPLTRQTKHVMNKATFSKMRDGALLISTSRGGLVNEGDLYEALVSGKLGGAGLDVFESEPINCDNPLYKLENVIITPHIGGSTVEALENVAEMASEEIKAYLETEHSEYMVNNPKVL
jgi:D-3-phosphoglycerate dehydrogenase